MLPVAVHEQHGAAPGVIEAGKQRGFLAEIARQREHLEVEAGRGQCLGNAQRSIPAAVVDIDHLDLKPARSMEPLCRLADPAMERRKAAGFIVKRHDDREPAVRRGAHRYGRT